MQKELVNYQKRYLRHNVFGWFKYLPHRQFLLFICFIIHTSAHLHIS